MTLLVREKAPLRLDVEIVTPDGHHARWGADERSPSNVPGSLTFSSTMPGGFESCSCVLERQPEADYPDLEELSTLTVHGAGGETAWQGRLERTPRQSGDRLSVSPAAVGWQAHLDDDSSASEIYVDRDLTRWGPPSVSRQVNRQANPFNISSGQAAADPTNNAPALAQIISDAWGTTYPLVENWYDAGPGNLIAKVWYDRTYGGQIATGQAWEDFLSLSSDDLGTVTEDTANLYNSGSLAEVSGYFAPAAAHRFAFLRHYYNLQNSGTAGDSYPVYWHNLAAYGNHGLTLQGPDPGGVFASDVLAHALGRWAPKLAFTTGPGGSIQPSTFVIAHLTFLTPTTCGAIVKACTVFELQDWAVWEGPTFFWAPRGTFARSWRARVYPAKLQETGPQVDRLFNGVLVTYTDVTGATRTVGPPGSGAETEDASLIDSDPSNPVNEAGLRRWTLLQMGTSVSAAAIKVGAVFLAEQKLLDSSGQATLVGHVEDSSGVLWPAWMVRAGDQITFIDAADPSPRRVISASYDDSAKACSLSLDAPPQGLQALLQRLQVVIQPLGF